MAAIGNASKHGALVREGDALERLAQATKICFDKTGTLTYGKPRVAAAKSLSKKYSDEEVYQLAATAETRSEHPLGRAIVSSRLKSGGSILEPSDFSMIPGRGVRAIANGFEVLVGNIQLMADNGISVPEPGTKDSSEEVDRYLKQGCTVAFIAINKELSGFAALEDSLRENVAEVISSIKEMGIAPVLITGDHSLPASRISSLAGIAETYSKRLPENKLEVINRLQQDNKKVCMVGDGINDAPALKAASAGIAMGGAGNGLTVDAADIVLMSDDIKTLPHILALAKRMMGTIKVNIAFSMTLNLIATVLAIAGLLSPIAGALAHNAGSVVVILNSALLLNWRRKQLSKA
jgi:P-type E1-E2 ATPase